MTRWPTFKKRSVAYSKPMNEQTVISRCDASTCRFNSDHKCTAGQVEVSMSANKAECLTFAPKNDDQGKQPAAQQ